jgi:hypothetical protein
MKKAVNRLCNFMLGLALLSVLLSCNDPTTVGAGILDNDLIPIESAEFELTFEQVEGSPVLTYGANGQTELNSSQCGVLEDDIFGRTEAGFYMQFLPSVLGLEFDPTRIIDSVFLILYLDSNATYGDLGFVTLAIDRMAESIDGSRSYFSDDRFETDEVLVSSYSFIPDFSAPSDGSTDAAAHIRIQLPNDIGHELFALDSSILNTDSAFILNFPGIYVRPVDADNRLVGFKPYQSNSQGILSGIRTYYRDHDTVSASTTYTIASNFGISRSPVVKTYEHDYTGSAVENYLNNTSDSLLFIQGHGGVNVNIKIDGLSALNDVLINKAELFIPINGSILDYDRLPEVRTLFLTRESLRGNREFIPEFFESQIFNFTPIGRLDTLNNTAGYLYNIPVQLQQMIDGTIFSNEMRLQNVSVSSDAARRTSFGPSNIAQAAARSVLLGRDQSSLAVRLKIRYTTNQ